MAGSTYQGWEAPESVGGPAPGVAFAAFGPRLVAYLIDAAIVFAISMVLFLFWLIPNASGGAFDQPDLDPGALVAFIVWMIAAILISVGYFPWFWAKTGATPGMRSQRLRVVRDMDGGPLTGGQALLRVVGYWISGAVLYLGFAWILIDARRRGWHDLIAGTVVIREP